MWSNRRQFIAGMGTMITALGLQDLLSVNTANAAEKNPVSDGKVTIEWLGHGSFLFVSPKGKKIGSSLICVDLVTKDQIHTD